MAKDWEPTLESLMTSRYGSLVARARVLGVHGTDAEDLVQSALIKTFARPRRFESVEAAEAYVKRVVVTEFLDAVQRRSAEGDRWRRATSPGQFTIGDGASEVVGRLDMAQALATLPPRVKACVVLRYLEDFSIEETSGLLGLSPGAVKRYVHDGLSQLNEVLGTAASLADEVSVKVTAEGRQGR